MPRGKIPIKRIEDPTTRHVTFCKRRGGLLKKACELSVLCDAEIALLIITPRGRIYEYASNNMKSTIDKYKKQTTSVRSNTYSREEMDDQFMQFYQQEVKKLRKQIYTSQISNEHLQGEGLDSLGMKELKQLETRVEKAISRIRSKKVTANFSSHLQL
ncbi:hypothetical protein SSX86_001898 [Deinandra increscens subsp. villosa]|uniref:Uncharacterized protein n=1 Tax=Deinandra increscens subsp. villosa TaxID=3103831 RepID=A0AAP0DX39_9ASTR